MGAEITGIQNGVVTLKVTGKLSESELVAAEKRAAEFIKTHGKIRILALTEGFSGWDRGGNWADFALQQRNDPHIEKMAIVGDEEWRDLALMFTAKGLRPFPIEHFATADVAKARVWLTLS